MASTLGIPRFVDGPTAEWYIHWRRVRKQNLEHVRNAHQKLQRLEAEIGSRGSSKMVKNFTSSNHQTAVFMPHQPTKALIHRADQRDQLSHTGSITTQSWTKSSMAKSCTVLWTDTLVTRHTLQHVQSFHSLLALHSHVRHATRVAQDKDCVPLENTSPFCASCLMLWHTLHPHSVFTFLSYPGLSIGGHIFDPLRRSTTSSSVEVLLNYLLPQVMSPKQPDRWWRGEYEPHWKWGSCQIFVLQSVVSIFNLRLGGKHRDATGCGLRWRITSCSADFTTVYTGARSKCRTITSISLWSRKLDVQFISRSKACRTGKPVVVFSSQSSLNQDTLSVRE